MRAKFTMKREQQFLTMLGNVRNSEASHLKLIPKDGSDKRLAKHPWPYVD